MPQVGHGVFAGFTVSVNSCVASAFMVNWYVPAELAAGVPLNVAVPSPLSWNVIPGGSVPMTAIVGVVGKLAVVTVKLFGIPTVKVAWFGLVMTPAC